MVDVGIQEKPSVLRSSEGEVRVEKEVVAAKKKVAFERRRGRGRAVVAKKDSAVPRSSEEGVMGVERGGWLRLAFE
jgi:hypothetical protein